MRFIAVYTATMFGAHLMTLLPSLFGLAYKLQVIDPAGKETSLGLVVGVGALINVVATPLAGVLTDRTRLRWGRRRPWIAAGIPVCAVSALGLAVAPNVGLVGAAWACYVVGNAAVLAGVTPVIADQIPETQRGTVGALSGVTAALAGVAASLFGSALTHHVVLMFLLPTIVVAACFPLYVMTIPDRPARSTEPSGRVRRVFRQLVFDPRQHRDFALVWASRFMLQTGMTLFSTYQLYFVLDRLGLTPQVAGQKLAVVGGIGIVLTAGFAVVGGWLSDRLLRRKAFIYAAAALAAAGLSAMAFAHNTVAYAGAAMLILAAAGLFGSVDLALAGDVVPDRSAAGRWMSILNVAGSLPAAIAPVIAPLILSIGGGHDYTALYVFAALVATGAGFTVWRVRGAA